MTKQKKKKEKERGGGKRTGRCLMAVLLVVVVAERGCRWWRCGGERERLIDVIVLIFSLSFSYSLLSLLICASFPFLSYSSLVPLSISLLSLLLPSVFFFCSFFLFFSVFLSIFIRSLLYNLTPLFFFSVPRSFLSSGIYKGEKGEREHYPCLVIAQR